MEGTWSISSLIKGRIKPVPSKDVSNQFPGAKTETPCLPKASTEGETAPLIPFPGHRFWALLLIPGSETLLFSALAGIWPLCPAPRCSSPSPFLTEEPGRLFSPSLFRAAPPVLLLRRMGTNRLCVVSR